MPGLMTSEENAMLACAGDPGYPQALTRSRMKEDNSWVNKYKKLDKKHIIHKSWWKKKDFPLIIDCDDI